MPTQYDKKRDTKDLLHDFKTIMDPRGDDRTRVSTQNF